MCVLLGGRYGEDFVLYRAISQESPDEDGAQRRRATAPRATAASSSRSAAIPTWTSRGSARCAPVLQPGDVLVADANTGWLMHQAARVVRAVARRRRLHRAALPRPTRSASRSAGAPTIPFVLDETIDSVDVLLRAHAEGAMDVVNLKISKFGGLTKARQARDLCVSLGIAMTIEDSWGGDITTAAIAHLAHSTPDGAALHRDRLQQLRHGEHRRGRPAAAQRPHGRLDGAGARRTPAAEGARPTARRGDRAQGPVRARAARGGRSTGRPPRSRSRPIPVASALPQRTREEDP